MFGQISPYRMVIWIYTIFCGQTETIIHAVPVTGVCQIYCNTVLQIAKRYILLWGKNK